MDIFDSRYYKSCKVLMQLLGLWPYQTNFRRRLSHFLYYALLATIAVPLIAVLWKQKSLNIIIESGVSATFTILCVFKYSIPFCNASRFKELFSQIAKDWTKITDKSEIDILCRYGEEGRFLVLFYTIYTYYAWVLYNMMPFLPPFLDIVHPLKNGTHPRLVPFYGNYILFDQADYHYETCIHAFVVYFWATTLFAGIDSIYVAAVKHTCGLFAIVWLETVVKIEESNKSIDLKNDMTVNHHLIKAIALHNETIRCCDLLEDSFSLCFFVIQFTCVITLAAGACYLLKIFKEVYVCMRVSAFFLGTVIHIYYLNWVGQLVIDSSSQVFDSATACSLFMYCLFYVQRAYELFYYKRTNKIVAVTVFKTVYFGKWYLISPRSRKLTNIIMVRSLYPYHLTAGKIMTFSMESYAVLMKTSMSYFTVLLSMT